MARGLPQAPRLQVGRAERPRREIAAALGDAELRGRPGQLGAGAVGSMPGAFGATRVHIPGASGGGTTTRGAGASGGGGWPHHDSDSYFWRPTDPPFTTPRPAAERLALLRPPLKADERWVLSRSMVNWGAPRVPLFDLVVFLKLDPALRLARLRARERGRHGARIAPGGNMAETSRAFLERAAAYDTAGPEQRSLALHEAWLARLHCPVLRLDSAAPVDALVQALPRYIPSARR
jgi:hypothetical protein